jgi:hypothetical protein
MDAAVFDNIKFSKLGKFWPLAFILINNTQKNNIEKTTVGLYFIFI